MLKKDKKYVIGIDLGGTKIEVCLLDEDKNLISRTRDYSNVHRGNNYVIDTTLRLINDVADGKKIEAVGMGTGGTLDPVTDKLNGLPHTPSYEDTDFIKSFRHKLSVPLVIENDANCLALAEYYASCAGKYSYVMAVIIGTGMGSGLILDNKLYRGIIGGAGEIGHNSIDFNGRICECGSRGCAEAYLSGRSLTKRFYELSGTELEVPEIYKLFEQGNSDAISFFKESSRMMGRIFANAINTLDLEAIILGGGVSNLPLWYNDVYPYIKESLFGPPREEIPIIKAKLGDSAGVVGAAYLALRKIGVMEF
jgi:predicted NBD/HSP70 family sugar kinase